MVYCVIGVESDCIYQRVPSRELERMNSNEATDKRSSHRLVNQWSRCQLSDKRGGKDQCKKIETPNLV